MTIDIPFVKNPGDQCGQACALMIIKYFYPKKKVTIKDINKVIRFKPDKSIFPIQMAIGLNHFGVKAKAFSNEDCPTGKKGIEAFKKWLGKDFNENFPKWVDYPVYEWAVKTAKKNGWFEIKNTPFEEIEKLFRKGCLITMPVDENTLHGIKNKPYQGIIIVITGFNKNSVYLNDPDEGKNLEYPKKIFKAAYNHPAIANDLAVAYGKI